MGWRFLLQRERWQTEERNTNCFDVASLPWHHSLCQVWSSASCGRRSIRLWSDNVESSRQGHTPWRCVGPHRGVCCQHVCLRCLQGKRLAYVRLMDPHLKTILGYRHACSPHILWKRASMHITLSNILRRCYELLVLAISHLDFYKCMLTFYKFLIVKWLKVQQWQQSNKVLSFSKGGFAQTQQP